MAKSGPDFYPQSLRMTKANYNELITEVHYINRPLAEAAYRLKYAVEVFLGTGLFRVKHGGVSHYFNYMQTPLNTYVSSRLSNSKFTTNMLLRDYGIPVPSSMRVTRGKFQRGEWDSWGLDYPLVIKPAQSSEGGAGVKTNIRTRKELFKEMKKSYRQWDSMLVEHYYQNMKDYRVLVLDGKVIAATERIPAYVIGDGRTTVRDLIEAKNEVRMSDPVNFGLIKVNAEFRRKLASQQLRMSSTPALGRRVQLQNVCNTGSGGEVHDETDRISPENKRIAIKAAKALDLRLAGIDFLCRDIKRSLTRTGGVIIEANQHPGVKGHHYPHKGEPRDVATQIMKAVFKK